MIGLRERKKRKTRSALQRAAMELVERQGYAKTTVEQIAARAEVSPATFFRYFASKDAALIYDEYDDLIVDVAAEGPADEAPMAFLRRTFRQMGEAMQADKGGRPALMRRIRLLHTEPALRAAMLDLQRSGKAKAVASIAERTGKSPDDLAIRVTVAAVFAAVIETIDAWIEGGCEGSLGSMLDTSFDLLERGLGH